MSINETQGNHMIYMNIKKEHVHK